MDPKLVFKLTQLNQIQEVLHVQSEALLPEKVKMDTFKAFIPKLVKRMGDISHRERSFTSLYMVYAKR
jgi:hypothetical protein